MEKKLYRDEYHKKVGGVCAGLAEYFNIDVTVVRILFLFTAICYGGGFILYIIMMMVMPKKGYPNFTNPSDPLTVNYIVPPVVPNADFGTTVPQKKSSGGVIFGAILIILGCLFLVNQFDLIPDIDFSEIWPIALVAAGIGLIIQGQQKKPWDAVDWHQNETKQEPVTTTGEQTTDNNPTV